MTRSFPFKRIRDMDPECPASCEEALFLTFDVDWAPDEMLSRTLDLVEARGVPATFFVTHGTDLLRRMRENPHIELGIHPDYKPLLQGDPRNGRDYREVTRRLLDLVPDAVSVRSHDLLQGSSILDDYADLGLRYECSLFLPVSAGVIRPFYHEDRSLLRVPHIWEDDIHCACSWTWDVSPFIRYPGIKVFDFHPVHVFMNTESLDRYRKFKEAAARTGDWSSLANTRQRGTRDFLNDLLERVP